MLIRPTSISTHYEPFLSSVVCTAGGLNYLLFEQYINVRGYLGELLLYASIGVFAVSLLVLINPLGTVIMIAVLAMTMVEIYGMLYYAGACRACVYDTGTVAIRCLIGARISLDTI